MIVVLDTNIWLKELALNSGAGSALRFFLKQRSARLAVPEVVRLEVQSNLRKTIEGSIDEVVKGHRQLLTLFGSMKELILPDQVELDELVSTIFMRLGVDILDVPFSFESAQSSFLKTIEKVPPSDKSQEFKDGVLWANCLELLENEDVLFATQDKAFCFKRELGVGLAENLLAEAALKPNKITLVHSVSEVLKHVKTDIHLDDKWLISSVQKRAHTAAKSLLSSGEAELSGDGRVQYELFITEKPEVLYMSYVIEIPCVDATTQGRTDMRLILTGNGTIQAITPEVLSAQAVEEILTFVTPDGTTGRLGNVYGSAHAVFGHRTVNHTVSYPLKIGG